MKKEENLNSRDKSYFVKIGVTAFLTVAAIILFFFLIFKFNSVISGFNKIMSVLEPIILGAVIAYLVNPMQNFFKKYILKAMRKIFKKPDKFDKSSEIISITLSIIVFILIIMVFFYMVIPEFTRSVLSLVEIIPEQYEKLSKTVNAFFSDKVKLFDLLSDIFNSQKDILFGVVPHLASGVWSAVNFLKNFIIGIVVAFYILASKKVFKAQFKKILCAITSREKTNTIIRGLKKCDKIFGGFINGKLLDSLIIGILCFIGVTVLRMPYAVLISVIVGVTNIIPIFGPYIGGAICGVLILLISPVKCLYFVIFIILLQTLDGNVIGPKILGDSTGLSAFWVMVAILIGGGLFGVLGMLLGVPTFAVIYYVIKSLLYKKLRKKKLPTDTKRYTDINKLYVKEESAENDKEPTDKTE